MILMVWLSLVVATGLVGCSGFFFGPGTKTSLTTSATNATYGTSITLTATVAPSDSAALAATGVATGTVTFYDGTTSLGSGTLSSGTASLAVSDLAVGSHAVYAVYGGDTNYNESQSADTTVSISSTLTATTTTLSASASSITYGSAVTLMATTSVSNATGTVNFYSGTTLLGAGTLASGVATLTTVALPVGTDAVTAVYAGDSAYASSTSGAVSVVVAEGS
ncbi:hypothetical protein Terro_0588 [Terriglobus roseus DSM 18391]|uniref:Bacterial Ig-like domain-containing protein n=2 Tax=Terriglobus roseus TaxID=392734 RepID=I3ZCG0_TERRK|nr:hypothetical protein Terro_0588 [Terriglobus roseus DSM 18391]